MSAVPGIPATRHAANESVHRTANERKERDAIHGDTTMKCECECFRVECASSFQITLDAYEAVRANNRSFVVAPGHQADDEPILSATPSYLVIIKIGEQGRIAASLDPR